MVSGEWNANKQMPKDPGIREYGDPGPEIRDNLFRMLNRSNPFSGTLQRAGELTLNSTRTNATGPWPPSQGPLPVSFWPSIHSAIGILGKTQDRGPRTKDQGPRTSPPHRHMSHPSSHNHKMSIMSPVQS